MAALVISCQPESQDLPARTCTSSITAPASAATTGHLPDGGSNHAEPRSKQKQAAGSSQLITVSPICPPALLPHRRWTIRNFMLVKEIGSGAASKVYRAICRKSGIDVAIKVYRKAALSALNTRQVEREIEIHSSLEHPHIIAFHAAFEDERYIYLVMEYASGGDLFDDLKQRTSTSSEQKVVAEVLAPFMSALLYLHQQKDVIHRDIKPENIVFTADRTVKLADFGLAINKVSERPVTRLGTLDYMAPEVLLCPDKQLPEDNKERAELEYSEAVDAWACGVLAYEIMVGRPPFGMSSREATMKAICNSEAQLPPWMSAPACDFIRTALCKKHPARASVGDLLAHPWITYTLQAASHPAGLPSPAPSLLPRQLQAAAEHSMLPEEQDPWDDPLAASSQPVAAQACNPFSTVQGQPGQQQQLLLSQLRAQAMAGGSAPLPSPQEAGKLKRHSRPSLRSSAKERPAAKSAQGQRQQLLHSHLAAYFGYSATAPLADGSSSQLPMAPAAAPPPDPMLQSSSSWCTAPMPIYQQQQAAASAQQQQQQHARMAHLFLNSHSAPGTLLHESLLSRGGSDMSSYDSEPALSDCYALPAYHASLRLFPHPNMPPACAGGASVLHHAQQRSNADGRSSPCLTVAPSMDERDAWGAAAQYSGQFPGSFQADAASGNHAGHKQRLEPGEQYQGAASAAMAVPMPRGSRPATGLARPASAQLLRHASQASLRSQSSGSYPAAFLTPRAAMERAELQACSLDDDAGGYCLPSTDAIAATFNDPDGCGKGARSGLPSSSGGRLQAHRSCDSTSTQAADCMSIDRPASASGRPQRAASGLRPRNTELSRSATNIKRKTPEVSEEEVVAVHLRGSWDSSCTTHHQPSSLLLSSSTSYSSPSLLHLKPPGSPIKKAHSRSNLGSSPATPLISAWHPPDPAHWPHPLGAIPCGVNAAPPLDALPPYRLSLFHGTTGIHPLAATSLALPSMASEPLPTHHNPFAAAHSIIPDPLAPPPPSCSSAFAWCPDLNLPGGLLPPQATTGTPPDGHLHWPQDNTGLPPDPLMPSTALGSYYHALASFPHPPTSHHFPSSPSPSPSPTSLLFCMSQVASALPPRSQTPNRHSHLGAHSPSLSPELEPAAQQAACGFRPCTPLHDMGRQQQQQLQQQQQQQQLPSGRPPSSSGHHHLNSAAFRSPLSPSPSPLGTKPVVTLARSCMQQPQAARPCTSQGPRGSGAAHPSVEHCCAGLQIAGPAGTYWEEEKMQEGDGGAGWAGASGEWREPEVLGESD